MKSAQYDALLDRLDGFTRKFYTNELIRGGMFSAAYVLALFTAINLLEYYLYLPPLWRKAMFYGFVLSSIAFIGRFIGLPLLKYYSLGKKISHEQAANIIGVHFGEVKDKLLNILQLNRQAEQSQYELIEASINQKIVELKPINFSLAIDLNQNRRYAKFVAPPLLLLLFIIIAAPNIIREGSNRLYHNDTYFEKEAPFQFLLQNKSLKALQFENFPINLNIKGNVLPAEVFVEIGKNTYKLKKDGADAFSYELNNIQQNTSFRFLANGYYSKPYTIEVVAKPVVQSFEVICNYPAYTGRQDEVLKNAGDLSVPAGSKLQWKFTANNTEEIRIKLGDSTYTTKRNGSQEFSFGKVLMQSFQYTVFVSNSNVAKADSVSYTLNVIPDLYPTISLQEQRDSLNSNYFYYLGEVSDDYGLRNLTFNYSIERADSSGQLNVNQKIDIRITSAQLISKFNYYWNFKDLGIKPGDKMTYYFEVWDNDAVHGSKSTRSNTMLFEMPSQRELEKQLTADSKELKDAMKDAMKDAKNLKNELRDIKDKLLDKKNMNWEDKKQMNDAVDKQKQLQEELKSIKDKLDQNFEKQNDVKEVSEQVKQKQEKLQDLFDKVMNDEIKKLYEKLEKMLEELNNKKDAVEKMDDMQMNNEKLEKELDRMLELFKKLEFNQKMEETANKLEELAKKQEELAKQAEQNKQQDNNKQLGEKQEQLKKDLQDAKKDVNDLQKMNEETKSEQDFKDVEKQLETAEQQMEDAGEDLKKQDNQSAAKNQKSASNNMKNAGQKMKGMKQKMEEDQQAEDMQALRQLLENIVSLSFDEEKLMNDIKATNYNNPKYVDLMKEQQKITENSKMVEDSLYALARRQKKIESFITKEINEVNKYLSKSKASMEERNVGKALSDQQSVMTGYNNLALMLSEALQNMQQEMMESKSDDSKPKDGKPKASCKKPGQGKPNLSQMQKQLGDRISQLSEMMKRDGAQKAGDKGYQKELSKQFSELAGKQAEIRKALEKLNQEENKDGKQSLGNLGEAIQKMNQTETQLVNKQLTNEMLKRQQEIFTRLLEAENAQRQRDEKKERESNTGKEIDRKMPPSLAEYLKLQQQQADFYRTVPPALKPYYKQLTEQYFRNIATQ
jgi:DNA repair exonuclease SbcCD ATPase subunit